MRFPTVTPQQIEDSIAASYVFTAHQAVGSEHAHPSLKLLTIVVLVMKNGFTVTGESACASPENFNAELGAKVAREHAIAKIWPLLGYQLRDELHKASST